MSVRTSVRVALTCLAALLHSALLGAQSGVPLTGRLIDSLNGEPVADAIVVLEELRRETTSGADGAFAFNNVPPGAYHMMVRKAGYSTRRSEVTAAAGAPTVPVAVDQELHFTEIVSVGAEPRSQFEAFQPTSVLSGQELSKQLETSLGETLQSQPGVTARSFGPGSSRPVVRGLSGDRVLILQDGQRMSDLSSQSGDHGVTSNPAGARRIEVVRGPATLLYGANAIGGLVNIISEDIPTRPHMGTSGNFVFDVGSAATEGGGAGSIRAGNGRVALTAGGGGRRSGDVDTPAGTVENSHARSGFGSFGLSWTGAKSYLGASYGYDDSRYGAPVVEEGLVELTPRKHSVSIRGGAHNLAGAFDAYRATLSVRRYRHEELLAGDVETAFTNNTVEGEVMGSHRAAGRLQGSLGGSFLQRAFDARGDEALSPAVDQRTAAAFVYEELSWPHVTLQFGGRLDRINYEPAGESRRAFTTGSGSFGALFRPAAADERLTVAVSVARAARIPALEELFYLGPHPGNFAFEVGNPDLEPEHALGFDVSLRWRGARASGELTYFRNDIRDFVFTAPLTQAALEASRGELAARFPGRDLETGAIEFPIVEYVGADSVLEGVEAHSDIAVGSRVFVELGLDYVRGTLKATGEALPRMPPLRLRGGVRYQYNAFQVGGEVRAVAAQDRLFSTETPTDGYQLVRLFTAYSIAGPGNVAHTFTVRLDNATNELYRNHLSLIKDLTAEIGRNLKVLYSVGF